MISPNILKFEDNPLDRYFAQYGNSNIGWFFLYDAKNGTYYRDATRCCRETFTLYFNKPTDKMVGFYFRHTSNLHVLDIKLINEFFVKIHTMLGLPDDIIFYKTTIDKPHQAVIAEVPIFWLVDNIRRSFFTLFLRCACLHYNGDIEKAFQSYDLLESARPVIDMFLKGNIHFAFDASSLRSTFIYTMRQRHIIENLSKYMNKYQLPVVSVPAASVVF